MMSIVEQFSMPTAIDGRIFCNRRNGLTLNAAAERRQLQKKRELKSTQKKNYDAA